MPEISGRSCVPPYVKHVILAMVLLNAVSTVLALPSASMVAAIVEVTVMSTYFELSEHDVIDVEALQSVRDGSLAEGHTVAVPRFLLLDKHRNFQKLAFVVFVVFLANTGLWLYCWFQLRKAGSETGGAAR